MNKKFCSIYTVYLLCIGSNLAAKATPWVVIGAGPAGITIVSVLLQKGVDKKDILWIDPDFKVGRLGHYYGNVPSNQMAARISTYISKCSLFQDISAPALEVVKNCDQHREPFLQVLVDVLQAITDHIITQVNARQGFVNTLQQEHGLWSIETTNNTLLANKVILATGSHPKRLQHKKLENISEIPLDLAIDATKLKALIDQSDTVMVVGSAHSAMLILKYLSEMSVKKIISVYSKQPTYGGSGLEGITAYWTKEVLEKNPPANILRVLFYPGVVEAFGSTCTKIIYAIGYERNMLPINGSTEIDFDSITGVIAQHLYGIGIAFPAEYMTEDGMSAKAIGINSFMDYAQELVPKWMQD